MPLPSPNLDDRDFHQLVEDARRRIQQAAPDWTDLTPHDPGIVLLELFAHLTETMIYRLNRLPEKAYIEFLRLIGVRIQPPAAASVILRFSRAREGTQPIEIPRGTRVSISRPTGGDEAPVFATARTVVIPTGEREVEVLAHHAELVQGELAGLGTGLPGLSLRVRRPPVIAPTGDALDLIVGVEARPDELEEQAPVIRHDDKVYRIWREVEGFTDLGPDRFAYVVDRMDGVISFAPAARLAPGQSGLEPGAAAGLQEAPEALAAVPPAAREIRLWYRRGGGPAGNVAAGTLTVIKDPIGGIVEVTNASRATGGQAAETLENALVRGPQELHSLRRAVTARDFELVAEYSSRAVARARALTQAALWQHAVPGTVEVLLVPHIPDEERTGGPVSAAALRERETETVRAQVQRVLNERRPLGTSCRVNWARYKTVRVEARIVVRRQADLPVLRQRVLGRLYQSINPLPAPPLNPTGWPFGRALRASHVYDIALSEPGVLWVDAVRLLVDEVPEREVTALAADAFQPKTWYAGSANHLFRSLNDGEGWETVRSFDGERIVRVRPHQERAGLLAVATRLPDGGSRLHISRDAGESWDATAYTTAFEVEDVGWMLRDDEPILLLATGRGLYELDPQPDRSPVQVLVDPLNQELGFYAVVASSDVRGRVSVAVAAQATGGVYLSREGGQPRTFRHIGLRGEDVRVLVVQYDGTRAFLWAGPWTVGEDPGKGCFRWELLPGGEDPPDKWRGFSTGWQGGSCRAIAFLGTRVRAATSRAGVLRLDTSTPDPRWEALDARSGLPLRPQGGFQMVESLAADPGGRLLMAGGVEGVYRSDDAGVKYTPASQKVFSDRVTLPPTWLFCSGEHTLHVVSEDEAERD